MNQEFDVLDDTALDESEQDLSSHQLARTGVRTAGLLGGAASLGAALAACGGSGSEAEATGSAAMAANSTDAQPLGTNQIDGQGSDAAHGVERRVAWMARGLRTAVGQTFLPP